MPFRPRFIILGVLLMPLAARAQAQAPKPAPPPADDRQVVTLQVALPTSVGYLLRMLRKDDALAPRSAPRTSNPVLEFTVPLPALLTRKQADDSKK